LCCRISDISKTQDEEVGDGTTSGAVLAGEFLRQAEQLIMQKIHPQTIIRGMYPTPRIHLKPH
jgi:T-complex protein 1 subunit beta